MAFVSQEDKKKLAPKIKEVLKKYNMKATISVNNHSTLCVNIKEGELDIVGASMKARLDDFERTELYRDPRTVKYLASRLDNYVRVNEYWIAETYAEYPAIKEFLLELKEAMEGPEFFNHDDSMTDYFFRSHYTDINVGNWEKPYVCTAEEKFDPEPRVEEIRNIADQLIKEAA
jgi:hypothetical protein